VTTIAPSPNDAFRLKQLRRTWLVIALLRRSAAVTLPRLAHEAGVSERTIRRDLMALESAGLPLVRVECAMGAAYRFMKGAPCPVCDRAVVTGTERRHEATV
jgi:predicted DNA-binding transcriptional regulator YafY